MDGIYVRMNEGMLPPDTPFKGPTLSVMWHIFSFTFLTALGLRCCVRDFLQFQPVGATLRCRTCSSPVVVFLVEENGASVVAVHGLSSCTRGLSCPKAGSIFPDQGWNPRPLHWQADSQPPDRQESHLLSHPQHFISPVTLPQPSLTLP